MIAVQLETPAGALVAVVEVPDFATAPDVVLWGDRAFLHLKSVPSFRPVYRQCVSAVSLTPAPGL